MKKIITPIIEDTVKVLQLGEMVTISGNIYCGRDAVLPKICQLIKRGKLEEYGIHLQGSAIFHTAVSPAGIGPTSSNKVEIEGSIALLSEAGVKLHIGKGAIKQETVQQLNNYNSVFAVIPPVTALLGENTLLKRCVAFPELGIEAFYELKVKDFPAVIAAAHGKSIY